MASLTSPIDYDTDGDGLSDGEELSAAIGTDPLDPDMDRDGVLDGDEIAAGANPLSANSDADALTDGEEIGTMALLTGNDFLWLDMDGSRDVLAGKAGTYSWQKQETRKGISSVAGTLNGGWGFHIWDTYDPDEGVILTYHSAGEAAAMVESRAITNHPVFEITGTSLNNPNATVADIREALAKHIPAVSSAVGKTNLGGSSIFCDDLNGSAYRSGWGRNDGFFPNLWLHSDLKDMAYHYVFPFFTELACRGELK